MIEIRNFLTLLCSVLSFTASTFSAPGTPNLSPKLDSSALYEASHKRSLSAKIDKRAIYVDPPPYQVPTSVRYVALYYDLMGSIRILMPTLIDDYVPDLVPLVDHIPYKYIAQSVLYNFVTDPWLSQMPAWQAIPASVTFSPATELFANKVVNLCIDFNILHVLNLQGYVPSLIVGDPRMEAAMVTFIQQFMTPYWAQSPSARLVAADPRGVNVEFIQVPSARLVGTAFTYVFQYLTPPATPLGKTVPSAQHNVTLAGNSTRVVTKLKLTNSTFHLDANLTKRATDTCRGFYPNLLPYIQSGPITEVGTNTISCAS